jgi:hypothetical protein
MEYPIVPDEDALEKCAWCRKKISDDMEVFGMGVGLKPGVDLADYEGHCIQLHLVSNEKPFFMLVTTQESEAKKEGNDGVFLLCCEACGSQLKTTLEKEISIGKIFDTVIR